MAIKSGAMSLSDKIRQQVLGKFRAKLAEHVKTMTYSLLALEEGRLTGAEHQATLEEVLRIAHSLKGAVTRNAITSVLTLN